MHVPPAWCVKDTPQGLRDDDLISSSSKIGNFVKSPFLRYSQSDFLMRDYAEEQPNHMLYSPNIGFSRLGVLSVSSKNW